MKIAFVLPQDVNDKKVWSGTPFYIYNHLKNVFDDVVSISPIENTGFTATVLKWTFSVICLINSKLSGKRCNNLYESYFLPKFYGKYLDKYFKINPVDCIISPANVPFVYTKNNIPLIIITDATIHLLYKEYLQDKGWSKSHYKNLVNNAQVVSDKADLIIPSSLWISESLTHDYKIRPAKVVAIPFGANMNTDGITRINRTLDANGTINFLFVGKGWERKGGDIAVKICDELLKQSIQTKLTVVGSVVPDVYKRDYIENHPFLNKNNCDDLKILERLYKEAHFFILFSRAEMYGIVFCEAAAYSLPCITNNVGAIAEIVINDKTGIVLPKETTPEVYAQKIKLLISNKDTYAQMSVNARTRFETLLNWDSFAQSLKREIIKVLEK